MYFSDVTLYLLILGLVPLVFAVFQAAKLGPSGFLSLRFLSILFIWIGYHLSPWLAYFSDNRWDSFLLVPKLIDNGLLFSLLSMACFLVGSSWIRLGKRAGMIMTRQTITQVPRIKRSWLFFAMMVSLVLFIINIGGLDEIWNASYFRGQGQFDSRVGWQKLLQMVQVVSPSIYVLLSCMAAFVVFQEKHISVLKVSGYLALIIASLQSIHGFSRGAGYPFIILAFLALRLKKRKGILLAVCATVVALYLGDVGLNQRGYFVPGLGNFLDAAFAGQTPAIDKKTTFTPDPERNPLDAMAPWTCKAMASAVEDSAIEVMGPRFFWNLHPFPSEIIPPLPLGRSLSEIMGTVGSAGITTPALAELYFVFGIWGVVFMIPLGMLYAYFDKQIVMRPGIISTICLLLCFISVPIGLHSSMRAMTRPLLYAIIIDFAYKWFVKHKILIPTIKRRYKKVWNLSS